LSASDGLSTVAVKRLDNLDTETENARKHRMECPYLIPYVCLSSDRNLSAEKITGKLREGISSSGRADIFSMEGWPVLYKT